MSTALVAVAIDAPNSIHGIDQRTAVIEYTHAALSHAVTLTQCGSGSKGFRGNTSSIIWPMARALSNWLCDDALANEGTGVKIIVRDVTRVVEIGTGLGLVGMAVAGLGARSVLCTDGDPTLVLLNLPLNPHLTNITAERCVWGPQELLADQGLQNIAQPTTNSGRRWPVCDLILASDIIYNQDRATMRALLLTLKAFSIERKLADASTEKGTRVLIAYEHRDNWDALESFWEEMEAIGGMTGSSRAIEGWEDDQLLLELFVFHD